MDNCIVEHVILKIGLLGVGDKSIRNIEEREQLFQIPGINYLDKKKILNGKCWKINTFEKRGNLEFSLRHVQIFIYNIVYTYLCRNIKWAFRMWVLEFRGPIWVGGINV